MPPKPILRPAMLALQARLTERLTTLLGADPERASPGQWLQALSHVVRDRLIERAQDQERRLARHRPRQLAYLSMEFLLGRALDNSLAAAGQTALFRAALAGLGLDLDALSVLESDPGLGNGGLGRLAACFLESMASLGLPARGYGIRYEIGMFTQKIENGQQREYPDSWLAQPYPWEIPRPERRYLIRFGGRLDQDCWVDSQDVLATAYDVLIPGDGLLGVVPLRLWAAQAVTPAVMTLFNLGRHRDALADRVDAETISRVLYPDDSTPSGQALRLRQEYFFCSASLQDILAEASGDLAGLADQVAIHLNDTHPALAVPEFMRLLVDESGVDWDRAWSLTQRIFSYTNHTLLPEALETWPVALLEALLPRHLAILYRINAEFLAMIRQTRPEDPDLPRRVSLIDEGSGRRLRMAWLAVIASHRVNGVSELHSRLMRETIFADFAQIWPDRFTNITNGVTPRRWLAQANPGLAGLIDATIGPSWRRELGELAALRAVAARSGFQADFAAVKQAAKHRLAERIRVETGIIVDPDSLFDVQIKRIHEYKRQLLNLLQVITRYQRLLAGGAGDLLPARTVIFSGKAAPGYAMAKQIIALIHAVAARINGDRRLGGRLKLVFLPNYSVGLAEAIIPAADLSEQISTAGTEASGTGNIKLALNGALTIGTADGATLEMQANVGAENMIIFGHSAAEIAGLRRDGYQPHRIFDESEPLRAAFTLIPPDPFQGIRDSLLRGGDPYFLFADYAAYLAAQDRVDQLYQQPGLWREQAILNIAGMGPFSSDRAIADYARRIWQIAPLPT